MKLPDWTIIFSGEGEFYHRKSGKIQQIITPDYCVFTTQRPDVGCLNEASAFLLADIFMTDIMKAIAKLEERLKADESLE